MWLEAKISKNLIGKRRDIGDRFECPLNAAMALLASGACRQVPGPHPLPDRDAVVNPEQVDDDEDALSAEDEELSILVGRAIDDGRMPALVDALTAVGLDPDDYSNNSKREAALHTWLES